MPLHTSQICLSDGNREALIIRWRTISILGLQDYFTNKNRFLKIVVREILDMFEGLMKAFGEALGVQNIENKGFLEIFNSIKNHSQLQGCTSMLNSIRNLIRNPEAHSLNLPSIPVESAMRCWRLFNEAAKTCNEDIFTHAQNRPEFKEFF